MRRTVPEGIRITKVGLWYILLALLVAIPAANTGNNALYMVEACLLALLVVSGVTSRQNLRKLEIELSAPSEIYAKQPFRLGYTLEQQGRLWDRRLLVIAGVGAGKSVLIPRLPTDEASQGSLELTASRRGNLGIPYVHLSSIYPLGLFRKGMRHRVDLQLLVLPRLLDPAEYPMRGGGPVGEQPSRRAGMGHDLFTLRSFREGDDRRSIHWKQTARTGDLIYMEREAEKGQRVSVLFDNGIGRLQGEAQEERFELLVSEAATAAHHFLEKGFEVELITRTEVLGFSRGRAHRRRILESLALVAPTDASSYPMQSSDPSSPVLRFGMTEAAS